MSRWNCHNSERCNNEILCSVLVWDLVIEARDQASAETIAGEMPLPADEPDASYEDVLSVRPCQLEVNQ